MAPNSQTNFTSRKEHHITRNCFHFKLFTGSSNAPNSESDNENDVTNEDTRDNPNHEEGQGGEQGERQVSEPAIEWQVSEPAVERQVAEPAVDTTPYFTNSSPDETII